MKGTDMGVDRMVEEKSLRASEVVEQLQLAMAQFGDLPVFVRSDLGDVPLETSPLPLIKIEGEDEVEVDWGEGIDIHVYPKRMIVTI